MPPKTRKSVPRITFHLKIRNTDFTTRFNVTELIKETDGPLTENFRIVIAGRLLFAIRKGRETWTNHENASVDHEFNNTPYSIYDEDTELMDMDIHDYLIRLQDENEDGHLRVMLDTVVSQGLDPERPIFTPMKEEAEPERKRGNLFPNGRVEDPKKAYIDHKSFLKSTSLQLKNRKNLLLWYQDLETHSSLYGIYIPPTNTLQIGNTMGSEWSKKNVGEEKHSNRTKMSSLLHMLLNNENMFPKNAPEMRNIVTAARGDGYLALHNIMRLEHPLLNEDAIQLEIPIQNIGHTFGDHVNNMSNYVERERLKGRLYTEWEQTELTLRRLHPKYELRLRERAERCFRSEHDKGNNIPFNLMLPNLGTTLVNWSKDMGLDNQQQHAMHEELDAVHAIAQRQEKTCKSCGNPGHDVEDCRITANFIYVRDHLKKDPTLENKILKKKGRARRE